MNSATRPALSVSGLALVGPVLAIVAACAAGGSGSERAQSNSISKRIEEVRITEDRMVADAKAASAARKDGYWRDANNFKDTRDKVCKLGQPESKRANPVRIVSMTNSI